MPSRSSLEQALARPSAAERLSEEAMDLVCSFVRDFKDDREMARTLCALSLTSRQWTSSAVRALFFDPTRAMPCAGTAGLQLLNLCLRRPHLARHVRRLERLPEFYQRSNEHYEPRYHGPSYHRLAQDVLTMDENWMLSILQTCPYIEGITISPEMPDLSIYRLSSLSRLHQLAIQLDYCLDPDDSGDALIQALEQVSLVNIEELTLDSPPCNRARSRASTAVFAKSPLERLTLDDCVCGESKYEVLLSGHQLKYLQMRALSAGSPLSPPFSVLPSDTLETFIFRPSGYRAPPAAQDDHFYMTERLDFPSGIPNFPRLTRLVPEYGLLHLDDLRALASACPALQYLSLTDCAWYSWQWVPPSYLSAFQDLHHVCDSLPNLRFLSLGYLPLFHPSLADQPLTEFCDYCEARDLDLRYRVPLVLEEDWIDGDEEEEEEEGETRDYAQSSDYGDLLGLDAPLRFYPNPVFPWSPSNSPFLADSDIDISLTSWDEDEVEEARGACDVEVFLDEKPDEPRLEEGYEAHAEEEKGEEENEETGLGSWEYEDSWEEGDRAWREFDLYPEYGALE
ncbi:hypothetical protein JCM11641_003739 [Rhodosporidiobolus odoratus]